MILLEADAPIRAGLEPDQLPPLRSAVLPPGDSSGGSWEALCGVLGLVKPVDAYPAGAPRTPRVFETIAPPDGPGLLRGYVGITTCWTIRPGSFRRRVAGSQSLARAVSRARQARLSSTQP